MNDIGMTLAWLAVQVSLVLAPGLVAYALAARRGPAAGASVASLCMGLVVVLTIVALLPGIGRGRRPEPGHMEVGSASIPPAEPAGAPIVTEAAGDSAGRRWPVAGWRVAWARFERGAAEPASRCRPWAGGLAVAGLAATAAGLLRLALGIAAVVACRRRGRLVEDPEMIALLDELRGAIGCRASVELREVPDLAGPATAGWRRPVILLPGDWRSWDDSERRAVLAHEVAHVVRGDYAAGLLARLAFALNGYHPMVRWMAGQLRLQQELAADAIGAIHAGGRSGYLVALSRLALRQDERSPSWPARSFLPTRGTLIRRIAMLRDETRIGSSDRPPSRARRLVTMASLVGVAAAVMMLRGPARGGEEGAAGGSGARPAGSASRPVAASAPVFYPRARLSGVFVVRPARAARHAGMDRILPALDAGLAPGARRLGIDPRRPGFLRLDLEDIDWITCGITFGRTTRTRDKDGRPLHTIAFHTPAIRTFAPFDWLAFLRQWRLECTEVRGGRGVYYRLSGPVAELLGPNGCAYLPDDRTIVFDEEKIIRELVGGEVSPPDFLRGPDWERACRGLVALAIDNRGDALARDYDLDRPDDVAGVALLKGVDRWTFSLDDAESMVFRAAAACAGAGTSATIARTIESLVGPAGDPSDRDATNGRTGDFEARADRMGRALLAHIRTTHDDRSVGVQSDGFGTLAELASIVVDDIRSSFDPREPGASPKSSKP